MAKKTEKTGAAGGSSSKLKSRNLTKGFDYFREVWTELKKVHWPSRTQLLTYTGVVLVTVGIVAIALWIIDSGSAYALKMLLGS